MKAFGPKKFQTSCRLTSATLAYFYNGMGWPCPDIVATPVIFALFGTLEYVIQGMQQLMLNSPALISQFFITFAHLKVK